MEGRAEFHQSLRLVQDRVTLVDILLVMPRIYVQLKKKNACFSSCSRNPIEAVSARVKEIGDIFCQHYSQPTENQAGSHIGEKLRGYRFYIEAELNSHLTEDAWHSFLHIAFHRVSLSQMIPVYVLLCLNY